MIGIIHKLPKQLKEGSGNVHFTNNPYILKLSSQEKIDYCKCYFYD